MIQIEKHLDLNLEYNVMIESKVVEFQENSLTPGNNSQTQTHVHIPVSRGLPKIIIIIINPSKIC